MHRFVAFLSMTIVVLFAAPAFAQAPSIRVTAQPRTYSAAGDVINFIFNVRNETSEILFSPWTIDDSFGTNATCPSSDLSPNSALNCSSSYTITQADVDDRQLVNIATVTGHQGVINPVTSPAGRAFLLHDSVLVEIMLTQTPQPSTYEAVGDVIDFHYLISNTGEVRVGVPFTVFNSHFGSVDCSNAILEPGSGQVCIVPYVITQEDIDAGSIVNEAFASGIAINNAVVISAPDVDTITFDGDVVVLEVPLFSGGGSALFAMLLLGSAVVLVRRRRR